MTVRDAPPTEGAETGGPDAVVAAPVTRGRVLSRAVLVEHGAVLAFFTVVATIATWPLAIKPFSGFYGFGNDNLGGANTFGWVHDATFGPGSPSFNPEQQAPFGYKIPAQALQPMDRLYTWVFGGIRQGLVVQNAQIFVSFVLAGWFMYLLAKHVTGNRPAAIVAGMIFTYSPFHLALAMQYGALSSIQWVPLFLLALVRTFENPTRRNAVLCALALVLVGWTSYYYLYFLCWFVALLTVVHALLTWWRRRRAGIVTTARDIVAYVRVVLLRGVVGGLVFLVLFTPVALPSLRAVGTSDSGATSHPLGEAVRYSARPWMLVIPPLDNPFFGDHVRNYVQLHLFDSPVYEQSLYLGVVAVLLALVALVPRRLAARRLGEAPADRTLFAAGVLIGAAMMIGPYLPLDGGYWRHWNEYEKVSKLPWIGLVMFHFASMFRFFARNFLFVSTSLAVLAAVGFARLVRAGGSRPLLRYGAALLACALVWAEFTNAPPEHWVADTRPPWVWAVQDLPADAMIVDYPIAPNNSPRSLYYQFWQSKHRRRTQNPAVEARAIALQESIKDPNSAATGAALAAAGFGYVVIHTKMAPSTTPPYQPGLPDDALPRDTGAKNPWFERIIETEDAVIYKVRPA